MIKKMTWVELITKLQMTSSGLITTDIIDLAEDLDDLMLEKFSIDSHIKNLLNYLIEDYFNAVETNNVWEGLPIIISSYAEKDKRLKLQYQEKLRRYLAFYIKFLTDDGLARRIVSSKTYSDNGSKNIQRSYTDTSSGSSTDNNIYSNLPQLELENFEQGIDYASNLEKNTGTTSASGSGSGAEVGTDTKSGTGSETRTDVSWDEGMKNLRTMLFNELVDYISEIPNVVYNYYCLDTLPYQELRKRAYDYAKNIKDVFYTR